MSLIADLWKKLTLPQAHSCAESEPFPQPELTDEIVYSDASCRIRKIWTWNVDRLSEDAEAGLLKAQLPGYGDNRRGTTLFVSVDGTLVSTLSVDFTADFREGLARVSIRGHGYGFVDRNMNFVIPAQYDYAEDFQDGRAKVRRGNDLFFIDKTGRELKPSGQRRRKRYQEVGNYAEGMCCVSSFNPRTVGLAYHSDYRHMAGTWGFINEAGEEVIPTQYIYAHDFEDGIAIVTKGKWTLDPKWDNQYNQGCYWTEEELWGGIDKSGNVRIPFIFDEIKFFFDRTDIFMAHYGGWPEGGWGVIDNTGKWLAEPIFKELYYETQDDWIVFYEEDPVCTTNDPLMGIYDLANQKVLFEPQFLDVSFRKDAIIVTVFDESLGRTVEKILDRSGQERFPSIYSSINISYIRKDLYEVVIRDADSNKHGLIDKNGNVILPCIYDIPWGGILYPQKRIHFLENGKQGVMDYDGNVIIPPVYLDILDRTHPFMIVRKGYADSYKEGLITADGKPVIPAKYNHIGWCKDRRHFFCCADGQCEMYAVEEPNRSHSDTQGAAL